MPKCHKKLEPYNPTKLHHFKFRYIIYAFLLSLTGLVTPAKTTAKDACRDISFIYVPASGQSRYNNADWPVFKAAVNSRFKNSGLSYSIDSLNYPAVTISDKLLPLVFTKNSKDYNASVATGVKNLKSLVNQTKVSCKNTKFAFAGFSQGAQVVSTALLDLDPNDVVFAATMGDPKLYLPEGKAEKGQLTPDACLGRNLSPYRTNVPDCKAAEGWLGGRKPYTKDSMINKLGVWCADGDPICSSRGTSALGKTFTKNTKDIIAASLNIAALNKTPNEVSKKANDLIYAIFQAHDSYHKSGAYYEAADHMLDRAAAFFPEKHTITLEPTIKAPDDLAIVIDTVFVDPSNVKNYVKSARSLADNAYARNSRVALYSITPNSFNPVVSLCDFSCSKAELNDKLDELGPDYYTTNQHQNRSVLWTASETMQKLSWRIGANKSLVIFTSGPFYTYDLNGTTLADVVQLSRSIDPVNIYVVGADTPAHQELAISTGGQVFASPEADLTNLLNRPAAIVTPSNTDTTPLDFTSFKQAFDSLGKQLDQSSNAQPNNATPATNQKHPSVPLAPNSGVR